MSVEENNLKELLNDLEKYGNIEDISTSDLYKLIEVKKSLEERKKYLEKHQYEIYYSKAANAWCTYIPQENGGRKSIRKKEKTDVEDAVISYLKSIEKETISRTIESVFYEQSAKSDLRGLQIRTVQRYEQDYVRFFHSTDIAKKMNISEMDVSEMTDDIMEEFILYSIRELEMSAKCYEKLKRIILKIFKYAKKHKYTTFSITEFFAYLDLGRKAFVAGNNRIARKKKEKGEVFTNEEQELIFNYIDSASHTPTTLGIKLLFLTGLRIGELAVLTYDDIVYDEELESYVIKINKREISYDTEAGKVFEVADCAKGGTTDNDRDVIITEAAVEIIKELQQITLVNPDKFIFYVDNKFAPDQENRVCRLKSYVFSQKLRRICKKVGIPSRSCHCIRKTYASNLIDNGVNIKTVVDQLGHADSSTTLLYYNKDRKSKKEKRDEIKSVL